MIEVISKLQFKEFETGEFVDEKIRTFKECQKIIEDFPWEKERENIKISLTNPSITFEKPKGIYLKLSTSFSQKFILNYYTEKEGLYSKSLNNYIDSIFYIEQFFKESTFNKIEFRKENTWLKEIKEHFESQDFIYKVTNIKTWRYLIKTSLIHLSLTIFICLMPIFIKNRQLEFYDYLVFGLVCFLVGGGLNIILFLNHYFYTKNKILILSKGNNIFWFGNIDNPIKFNKIDILNFTTISYKNRRSPISEFALLKIEMNNGEILKIPSILLDNYSWERKLFNCKKIEKAKFPFVKN